MAQGFKNVFAFALYLNLSCLAKFNLSQSFLNLHLWHAEIWYGEIFYRLLPNSHIVADYIAIILFLTNPNPLFDIFSYPLVFNGVFINK